MTWLIVILTLTFVLTMALTGINALRSFLTIFWVDEVFRSEGLTFTLAALGLAASLAFWQVVLAMAKASRKVRVVSGVSVLGLIILDGLVENSTYAVGLPPEIRFVIDAVCRLLILAGAMGLIVRTDAKRTNRPQRRIYRWYVVSISVGGLVDFFIYLVGGRHWDGLILTVLGWLFFGGVYFFLILNFRHIVPEWRWLKANFSDFTQDAVLLLTDDGAVSRFNDATDKVFGRPMAAVVGHPVSHAFDDGPSVSTAWEEACRCPGYPVSLRVRSEGKLMPIELYAIENQHSLISGGIAVVRRVYGEGAEVPYGTMTIREQEICSWLLRGYNNRQIADHLYIALGTVKIHVHNILEKVGAKSRVELMSRFLREVR